MIRAELREMCDRSPVLNCRIRGIRLIILRLTSAGQVYPSVAHVLWCSMKSGHIVEYDICRDLSVALDSWPHGMAHHVDFHADGLPWQCASNVYGSAAFRAHSRLSPPPFLS